MGEIPTGDQAIYAFLEMVALAFAFEGVSALLSGRSWLIWITALLAAVVFFCAGIKWPYLKTHFAKSVGLVRSRIIWLIALGLLVALFVFSTRTFTPLLDHSFTYFEDVPASSVVLRQAFSNQEVRLDGIRYVECSFENVTFIYNGTRPYELIGNNFRGTNTLRSDSKAVSATVGLLYGLGMISSNANVNIPGSEPPR